MKKQILILSMLLLFIVPFISAMDYSITGDRNTKTEYYTEKVSFDTWHSDGRASVYNPVNGKWSKGISPSGQGSFMYTYDINNPFGDYRKSFNLRFEEVYSYDFGEWIYSYSLATGTYWVKGSSPLQLKDISVSYWYNKVTGKVYISTPYLYVSDIVIKNK